MLLAQAVDGMTKFSKGSIQTDQYLACDSYQAQLVVLASQVTWSTGGENALDPTHRPLLPHHDRGPGGEALPLVGIA